MNRYTGLIVDVIAIAVFAFLARLAHQSDSMPLSFLGWLETLWPFLLGVGLSWILISLRGWDGARPAPAGVSAWLITAFIGLVIWGLRNASVPHWSFILVATVMSGLLMLGWRALARLRRPEKVEQVKADRAA